MLSFSSADIGIDIRQVEQALRQNRGFPIHTYHDPRVYEFEMEAIFARTWQYFAPLDKLTEAGTVVTGMIGKIPIAVARAHDGKLYGFVNICRHRGFTVVESDKKCRLLVCRYHAWAYHLNGELARASGTEEDSGFNKLDYGLLPVSVDVWAQAVFVNPHPNAVSLRQTHPQLDDWTNEKGFRLGPHDYTFYRQEIIDQKANWKLWYDNGTECYHCPTIHGDSFNTVFNINDGEYGFETRGAIASLKFPGMEAEQEDALCNKHYCSFQFFPGCQLIQQDDVMLLGKMTPTGPQSCRWTIDYLIQKGTSPARADQWIEIWNKTYQEDAQVVEIQQKNLPCDRAKPFRFVPGQEGMSQFMHRQIWEAYKANLSDGEILEAAE